MTTVDDLIEDFQAIYADSRTCEKNRLKFHRDREKLLHIHTAAAQCELRLLDIAGELWYSAGDEDVEPLEVGELYSTWCDGFLHYIVENALDECKAWYFCNCGEEG